MKLFYFFIFLLSIQIVLGQNRKPTPPNGVEYPITYKKILTSVVKVSPTIFQDENSKTSHFSTNGGTRAGINLVKGTIVDDGEDSNDVTDNTIAVSTDYTTCAGQQTIVSAKNSKISFYKIDGSSLGSTEISSFVNNPVNGYQYSDPKLLFDSDYNRYIFSFFRVDPLFTETVLYVYVSETCDPLGVWYGLIIPDTLFLDSTGTEVLDRPVIGMSQRELYISINASDDGQNSTFRGSRLLAIEKDSFYYQKAVFLRNVQIPGIDQIYGLHPVSYGYIGNYYPGIYLVYTKTTTPFSGFDSVYMYNVTADIFTDTAKYLRFAYKTTTYNEPLDVGQKNDPGLLRVKITRIYDAFYFNGTIHFVYHKKGGVNPNFSEISYNRIDVANNQLTESVYSNPNYACAYPSVSMFTNDTTDKSALIGFLTCGPNSYPSFHAVACNDSLVWGSELSIIEGDTFMLGGGQWGDYSGAFRNHSATTEPICWLSGQYSSTSIIHFDSLVIIGNDTFPISHTDTLLNVHTYLAEIKKNAFGNSIYEAKNVMPIKVYPNPTQSSFHIDLPKGVKQQEIKLKMYNMEGNLIKNYYQGSTTSIPPIFELPNLPAGVYIIELSNKNNKPLSYEKLLVY